MLKIFILFLYLLIFSNVCAKINEDFTWRFFMKKLLFLTLALLVTLTSCKDNPFAEKPQNDEGSSDRGDVVLPYDDIDLEKYIEIDREDYIGVEYTKMSNDISDAEVKAEVESYRQTLAVYTEVTDRGAEKGDIVTLDYSGSLDGVKFDGGTATNQKITLGAGGFIDGFEDGIYSHKTGETFVVDAFFPENYGKEELNGKTAQFEMTIHKIEAVSYPTLTDEYLQENTDYKSLEELEATLRKSLEESLAIDNQYTQKNEAFAKVVQNVTILDYPEEPYQRYYDEVVNQYKAYAEAYQMDFDTFITEMAGSTPEEFYSYAGEYAKSTVDMELVFFSIAKAEGILDTMTKERFDAYVETIAGEYSTTPETFVEQYGEKLIWSSLVYETVLEFIFENAVEVEA